MTPDTDNPPNPDSDPAPEMAPSALPSAPPSAPPSADDIAAANRLFLGPVTFMLGVVKMATLPDPNVPEIAFAGRSNVGKSSLLNALTGRKDLARTSNTPGRTRELNFFALGAAQDTPESARSAPLRLVDLPGYGYARASKKDVSRWTGLVFDYLQGRTCLKRVCLLIDSRRGIMDIDDEAMSILDTAAVSYQIVLTKADKVKGAERDTLLNNVTQALKRHPAAHPVIHLTSSVKKTGLEDLRLALAALAQPPQ